MIDLSKAPFYWNGETFPTIGGRPALITSRDMFGPRAIRIRVEALGRIDDDLRLQINGITISDTRWRVRWYAGENFVSFTGPASPGTLDPSRWRRLRMESGHLIAGLGRLPESGDMITLEVFDGWVNSWQTSPCLITIDYEDGQTQTATIGSAATGASAGTTPDINDFPAPPAFANYYAIGTVALNPDRCCTCVCEIKDPDIDALYLSAPVAAIRTAFTTVLAPDFEVTRMCRRFVLYCYDAEGNVTPQVIGNTAGVAVSLSDAGYIALAEPYRTAAAPNKKEIIMFVFYGIRNGVNPPGSRPTTGSTTDYDVYIRTVV